MPSDHTNVETEGTFLCSTHACWSGRLQFDPEEVRNLDGDIARHMGPCPQCSQNTLSKVNDRANVGPDGVNLAAAAEEQRPQRLAQEKAQRMQRRMEETGDDMGAFDGIFGDSLDDQVEESDE